MKLLVVRLRLIGDVALTTPLLRGLRRRHPDANITYLAEKTETDAARIRGRSTRENVDKAVTAARKAFDEGPWPRLSVSERMEKIERLAASPVTIQKSTMRS